jgi:hypothetical protein
MWMKCLRRAVGVLILLDVDEMPVEIRYQDRYRRAVGLVRVAGVLDGVGGVEAGIDYGQVRLLTGRGEFICAGLAEQKVAVEFLLGQVHAGRGALHDGRQAVLVRAAGDGGLEETSNMTTYHLLSCL